MSTHWSKRMTVAIWLLMAITISLLLVITALPRVLPDFWREGATMTPETAYVADASLGMLLIDIDSESGTAEYNVKTPGVYVLALDEDSAALQAGVQAGDRLVMLNDIPVENAAQLSELIDQLAVGGPAELRLIRDGELLTICCP